MNTPKNCSVHLMLSLLMLLSHHLLADQSATAPTADASSTNREPHFFSKIPWSVGFAMEGTVTNVTVVDERIHLHLNGRFWLSQYPPEGTTPVKIEVHRKGGFRAIITPDSFVAMTRNWSAGSVQNDKTKLLKILQTAAERGTVVKFELTKPNMDFDGDGFRLLDAKVLRITDVDLH